MVGEAIDIIIIGISVFLLNVNPIFTIPTWLVVSLFAGDLGLTSLLPIFAMAVLFSTIGRYLLAKYSGPLSDRYLPKKHKESINYLKFFMKDGESPYWPFFISFLFALSPLPTNALFIVAGATRIHLSSIVGGFFVGEILSGVLYLSIFKAAVSYEQYLIFGIIGVALAVAILFADWKKIIKYFIEKEKKRRKYNRSKKTRK